VANGRDTGRTERSLIQERTKAGRATAITRGVKMGRKSKLTPQQAAHAKKLIKQGEHHDTVAKSQGVSRRTAL
jgi:DNA invertase Pin-like site-specific DNA recombinase